MDFNKYNDYPILFAAFIIAEWSLYTIIIVCNVNNVLYLQIRYCPYSLCDRCVHSFTVLQRHIEMEVAWFTFVSD